MSFSLFVFFTCFFIADRLDINIIFLSQFLSLIGLLQLEIARTVELAEFETGKRCDSKKKMDVLGGPAAVGPSTTAENLFRPSLFGDLKRKAVEPVGNGVTVKRAKVQKRINVRDLMAVLDRHPMYHRSRFVYDACAAQGPKNQGNQRQAGAGQL